MNVTIAVIISGIFVVAFSTLFGAATLMLCLVTIYFRGYLIPGTPTLTRRYLPERIHQLFGTHHALGHSTEYDTEVGELLCHAGVVTDCEDKDGVCLETGFRDGWRERIREIRTTGGQEQLATHLGIDSASLSLEEEDGRYWLSYEGDRKDAWLSKAAFLADMGAEPTLRAWYDGWDRLNDHERTLIIASLRAFLERCPSCDSELEATESTWESCCREGTTASIECPSCGDSIFRSYY